MPWIMAQPCLLEVVDQGNVILFPMDEYDTVRTFCMDPETETDNSPPRVGRLRGVLARRPDEETTVWRS